MPFNVQQFAVSQIWRIALSVRNLEEVWRNCSPIVIAKAITNIVTRRSLFRGIEFLAILQECLHAIRVGSKHFCDISFRKVCFRKPPNGIDCVLRTDFAFIHPLYRGWELRWVKPKELFCQVET